MKDQLNLLFKDLYGVVPDRVTSLNSAGSNRTYYRMEGAGRTCVGVVGTDAEENGAFCALSRHFLSKGLPVPEVYAVSQDGMCYLQEDLGDDSLFGHIAQGRSKGEYDAEEVALLRKTVAWLPDFQIKGGEGWDFSRSLHGSGFNRRSIFFDLNYFKYCFLKGTGIEPDEEKLEDDFNSLADLLLEVPEEDTFMYRDFQARNVMVKDGEPFFIDFQGGRRGPVYYDLASFVWQARSNFPESLRRELVQTYLTSLRRYRDVDEEEFAGRLKLFVFFRTLQVLGAYGFRGLFERKRHFIESIPYAVANLRSLLPFAGTVCPYLAELLGRMAGLPRFNASVPSVPAGRPALEVRVCSFSYRKGIPEDGSGNGGGYVFDCRGVHNPGKYERYRHLTGMDAPVIEFLEKDGEIFPFLENAFALADAHVERFIERGFTHLMFCFGCTGGQHRSVYSAEAMARHLSEKYHVKVCLEHREQGIRKEL